MGQSIKCLAAKLVSSATFLIVFVLSGVAVGACVAGFGASEINAAATLILVAVAGIATNRFAFSSFEMDLFFGLCVLVGAVGLLISSWFVAVPGGVLGMYATVALTRLMDKPNIQSAPKSKEECAGPSGDENSR
jgi:hypothetical protein